MCSSRRHSTTLNPTTTTTSDGGIILPRIIFFAEDDNQDTAGDESFVVGLEKSVISSYPKFQFSKEYVAGGGDSNNTCSICLCEYKEMEMLRTMPECRHLFHLCCIYAWLKLNGACPVCRNSPLTTPLATSLLKVVPLSQYAAD